MEQVAHSRSRRIDILRGIAIFGILLVNVWNFTTGSAYSYGAMSPDATWLDKALVFGIAAFAEFKFYPLFAFLFGVGFVLQTDSLRARPGGLDLTKRIYRRRLWWLLGCGVVHGTLLFSGDILTAYALVGFWLLFSAGKRTGEMVQSLKHAAFVAGTITLISMGGGLMFAPDSAAETARSYAALVSESSLMVNGSWLEVARQRMEQYVENVKMIIVMAPHIATCFMLGAVATRLGWITRPERYRKGWRRVRAIALVVSLPANLWIAWHLLERTMHPLAQVPVEKLLFPLLTLAGPILTAAYVAHFMLFGPQRIMRWAKWLAPVGRMGLTNYIAQSVLLGVLLQGGGFGLAKHLSHAGLVGLCVAIMALQLIWSRRWLARHRQGPLEALWRRHTYRLIKAD
jgi:uncharacterized protein